MSETGSREQPVPAGTDGAPELEYDETVAPRPEEEAADVGRATPDVLRDGTGRHRAEEPER